MPNPFPNISDTGAVFSPDRTYRYKLWRNWNTSRPPCTFIGLNPSTATEILDDPTNRRCRNFAHDWGFGSYIMLNLFGYRATIPKDMKAHPSPLGPENTQWIEQTCRETLDQSGLVIACWGIHGEHLSRGDEITHLLSKAGIDLHILGSTKHGHPKHPLYLRKDLMPALWV